MPWCPKCKVEYQEGYTVCSDCDVELVEELSKEEEEYIPFFQSEQKSIAEKLSKYFSYSGLTSVIRFHEEMLVYIVYVPSDKRKQAQKLYQAFYFVERELHEKNYTASEKETEADQELSDAELMESEEASEEVKMTSEEDSEGTEEEPVDLGLEVDLLSEDTLRFQQGGALYSDTWNEDVPEEEEEEKKAEPQDNTSAYVMKSEKYKDYNSTVSVFLSFGLLGIVFVILNITGVLNVLSGTIPNVVMGALFLFFLYIGISTQRKAKELRLEIDDEQKKTEEINHWLQENITPDYLASLHDESVSEEVNFFRKTEAVKEKLQEQFADQQEAYLDRLIDEFFNADMTSDEPEV